MESTDIDKIIDKLLVFRGRMPRSEDYPLTWWQKAVVDDAYTKIDDLILTLDRLGEAFE